MARTRYRYTALILSALITASATLLLLTAGSARDRAAHTMSEAAERNSGPEPLKVSQNYRLNQILVFHTPEDARRMVPLNDTVMGGVSGSEFVSEDGFGVFRGNLSRDQGGGFASVRSRPASYDLSAYAGLAVRVKGDGNPYSLNVYSGDVVGGVSWRHEIDLPAGEWTDVAIPFEDFKPMWRGRDRPEAGPLDPSRISSIGFMISTGAEEGAFELHVGEVSAYEPVVFEG